MEMVRGISPRQFLRVARWNPRLRNTSGWKVSPASMTAPRQARRCGWRLRRRETRDFCSNGTMRSRVTAMTSTTPSTGGRSSAQLSHPTAAPALLPRPPRHKALTATGSQSAPKAALRSPCFRQFLNHERAVASNPAAGIVPPIRQHDGTAGNRQGLGYRLCGGGIGGRRFFAEGEHFTSQGCRQCPTLLGCSIRDHKHFGANS